MDEDPFRRGLAEFVGAFTLIFIGGGAGIVSHSDIVAVALANGLAIGIMVTNLGHISGGHFNPAITMGFVVTRRIKPTLAAVYWFSQLLGAVCAAFLLRYFFTQLAVKVTAPAPSAGFTDWKALLLESVLLLGTGCGVGTVYGLYGEQLLNRALNAATGFPVDNSLGVTVALVSLAVVLAVACFIAMIPGYLAARVPVEAAFRD